MKNLGLSPHQKIWCGDLSLKNYLIFVCLVSFVLVVSGCQTITKTEYVPVQSATFVKGPYLLYPNNNTSMTIMWQTDITPESSTIEWGTTTAYESSAAVTPESTNLFSYTITGLNPGTRVFYKVTVDVESYASHFFTAPPSSATSLSFYAYGDTRSFLDLPPQWQNDVVTAMLQDMALGESNRQTFVVDSGDLVMWGLSEESWRIDRFNRDFPNLTSFFSKFPTMVTTGNHETYHWWDETFTEDLANAGKLVRKYYPFSMLADPNRNYYSFDYGPVHFTVLDQYTLLYGISGQGYDWEAANNTGQFAWLKQDLQNTTKPWKIVAFHEPAWTAVQGYGFTGNNLVMQQYYGPVFEQYGVKVVVQGHIHYYSRCATEEIQYLTLGGGGAELEDFVDPSAPAFVTGESQTYHFARFDVLNNNSLKVTVINKDGGVIDSFTVTQ